MQMKKPRLEVLVATVCENGLAWRAIQWIVAKTVEEQCAAAVCSCIVQSQYAKVDEEMRCM